MTIKQLIEKYTADRDYFLISKYNETLLRSDLLYPLFKLLGWDIKNNAVEAAKFGLFLKLLEGEDVNSTNKTKPVLPALSRNVFFGNRLLNPKQVTNKKDQIIINPFDFLGNPSYMKSEDMKNITPLGLPLCKTNYDSIYKQFDKYFLDIPLQVGLSATIFLTCGTKRIFTSIPNAKAA